MSFVFDLLERDLIPDPLIRTGVRRLVAGRAKAIRTPDEHALEAKIEAMVEELKASPIALATATANEQHYEVPTSFYQLVLGRHLKYSSAFYGPGIETLDDAEAAMLELYLDRAELEDGQEILELGCGWGSLTLLMAERFPSSRITAVSNSATQRQHIEAEAERRGLGNLRILTADLNDLVAEGGELDGRFERVVSIEMFEHMRNYQRLMGRIAEWLVPGGKLFVHIFCHHRIPYPFEVRGDWDWMARYFFTGGLMPSADLLLRFQDHLELETRWLLDGTHYQRTSEAWLANMDAHRAEIEPIFAATYGADQQRRWWVWWRVFFISCAELFGYRHGQEWMVAHYLFRR